MTLAPTVVANPPRTQTSSLLERILRQRWVYVFMLPSLVLTVMFTLYPIFASFYYSLFQWSGFTSRGLFTSARQNYADVQLLIINSGMPSENSFVFMLSSVPIKLTLGIDHRYHSQ